VRDADGVDADHEAEPRAKNIPASVAIKGGILNHWINYPSPRPAVRQQQHRRDRQCRADVQLLDHPCGDHRRQRDHGTDGKIDPAGEDHEGGTDSTDQQEGIVDEQIEEHPGGEESLVLKRRGQEHQNEQSDGHHQGRCLRSIVQRFQEPVHRAASFFVKNFPNTICRNTSDWISVTTQNDPGFDHQDDLRRYADRVDRGGQRLNDQRSQKAAEQVEAAAAGDGPADVDG
jgi:hypothetical protein